MDVIQNTISNDLNFRVGLKNIQVFGYDLPMMNFWVGRDSKIRASADLYYNKQKNSDEVSLSLENCCIGLGLILRITALIQSFRGNQKSEQQQHRCIEPTQNTTQQQEKVEVSMVVLGNGVQEKPFVAVKLLVVNNEQQTSTQQHMQQTQQKQKKQIDLKISIQSCQIVAPLLGQRQNKLFLDVEEMVELIEVGDSIPGAILHLENLDVNYTDMNQEQKLKVFDCKGISLDILESSSSQILVPAISLQEAILHRNLSSQGRQQFSLDVSTLEIFLVSSEVEVAWSVFKQLQFYYELLLVDEKPVDQDVHSQPTLQMQNEDQQQYKKERVLPQASASINLDNLSVYMMGVQQQLASVLQIQKFQSSYEFQDNLNIIIGCQQIIGMLVPQPIERLSEGILGRVFNTSLKYQFTRPYHSRLTPAKPQSWYSMNEDQLSSPSTRQQTLEEMDFFSIGDAASGSINQSNLEGSSEVEYATKNDFENDYNSFQSLMTSVGTDDYVQIKKSCEEFGAQLVLFSIGGNGNDGKITTPYPCQFSFLAAQIYNQNRKLVQSTVSVPQIDTQSGILSQKVDVASVFSNAYNKWIIKSKLDNIVICINHNGWDIVLSMFAQCSEVLDACQTQHRRLKYEFSSHLSRLPSSNHGDDNSALSNIQTIRFECCNVDVFYGHLNVSPESSQSLPIMRLSIIEPLVVWNQFVGTSILQLQQINVTSCACKWSNGSWEVFQNLGEIIGIKQVKGQAFYSTENENFPLRINFGVSDISLRLDYESLVVVSSLISRCSFNQNFDNQSELMRKSSSNAVKIPQKLSQVLKRGISCTLVIDQIACLVSHNSDSILVPIMEIVSQNIETEFSVIEQQSSSLKIQGSASLGLLADVYNDDKLGWEPLLEPWMMDLQFSLLNTLAASDPYSRSHVLNSVSLFSNNSLELSLSAPIVATTAKLQEMQKQIQASSRNFSNFIYTKNKNQGTLVPDEQDDQYVLVWLHNLCGQSIEYLLSDKPIFNGTQHNKADFVQVQDQEPVKLLQVSSGLARKKGRYMDSLSTQNEQDECQLGSLKHQHFCFYVEGDGRMLGPRDLSNIGIQTYDVQISQRVVGMDVPKSLIQAQVICEVQKEKYGTRSVYIHSRLQLCNKTALTLRIGYPQTSSSQTQTFTDVTGGATVWLPVQQVESGSLCVKPLPSSSYAEDAYKWSQSIKLKDILPQIDNSGVHNSGHRGVKQSMDKTNSSGIKDFSKRLVCLSNNVRIHESVWVNVGVKELSRSNGYALEIRPTLEVVNQLPVPCEVVVHEVRQGIISYREMKLNLGPGACEQMPNINGLYTNQVSIKPLGFSWSRIVELPPISNMSFSSGSLQAEVDVDSAQCCRLVPVDSIVQGGPVSLFVERSIEEFSEMATLTFSCAYWVYNYTGIPIALKEADTDSIVEDFVPRDWILPFNQSQSQPYGYEQDQMQRKSSYALESVTASRSESSSTLVGLAEVIEGSGGRWRGQLQGSLKGATSLTSPAGSMMGPSLASAQWPSMFGKVLPNEQTVKLKVRASQVQGINTSYWSDLVDLDALGGAAVVKVLCPIMSNGPQIKSNNKAAYYMSVTASRVGKGQRAWQLHIMPRFVLHNSTEWTIQYKQINTLMDKELLPGCRRPVHWADNDINCRLSVRIQEAGWMWSGGFSLEKAGDFFVKIRQRDAGDTVLLRVDISSSPTNGVILVRMSHQAVGFAPYRLDNFSSETLHVRQEGCTDQEDVLKPYCQLPYAWDEPSLPHQLILELPGHRYLGTFDLDNVGDQAILRVPSNPNNPSTRHNQREHQLHAVVLAEGPTRVLAVMDMGVHIGHPLLPHGDQNSTELLGWEEWSLPLKERQTSLQQSHSSNQVTFFPRATLEIKINVASIGLSLVGEEQELVYIGTRGIQIRFCNSKVRQTLELVLNQVYWDNCLSDATFPVMLAIPVVRPVIGTGVLLDNSRPAVSVRIAVWNRRPGGVICAQLVGINVAPLALEVEEGLIQHLVHFAATLNDCHSSQTLNDQREGGEREEDLSSESMDMDPLSTTQQTLSQHKVYIEKLQISQLDISISFTLVQWSRNEERKQSILRRVAALADVNDARISLASVDLSHPLMGASALREFFVSHYFNSLLRELYKLVGSADLLGDPVGLVRHLRLGVWSLIANPTSSLLDSKGGSGGIGGFASGLATGINSMIINTTFALSNATSKMSSAARNSLLALGLEEGEKRASRSRLARAQSSSSLIQATLQGVAGVVSEPVKGFEQGGVVGLAKGSVAGALGVVARPLASVLDMSNVLANNILSYIDSSPGQLLRARVPRYVSSKVALEKYDYLKAVGQQLVGGILSGEFGLEQFWACFELQADHCYLILTHQMLLHIQVPEANYVLRGSDLSICSPLREPAQLLWAVNLGDVEFINREDKTIRLMLLSVSSPGDLQDSSRKYAINLGSLLPPLQTIRVALRDSGDAERALQIIQLACQYAAKRYSWLGGTVGTTLIVNNSQKNV